MSGKHDHIILFYLFNNKTVTRLECDIVGLSLGAFLDAVAKLIYKNLVTSSQIVHEPKGGNTMVINQYELTSIGKIYASNLKGKL